MATEMTYEEKIRYEERERILKIIDEMSFGIEKKSRFDILQELKSAILWLDEKEKEVVKE